VSNGPARAEFWRTFLLEKSSYPAPDRLRAQLAGAEFAEFCDCGCNSFAVRARADTAPLVPSGGRYRAIYTEDFKLKDGRTLEIILFADGTGNLVFIEVDCCANSYPVPQDIDADDQPFQTSGSKQLLH
jgi:hypothetical protein